METHDYGREPPDLTPTQVEFVVRCIRYGADLLLAADRDEWAGVKECEMIEFVTYLTMKDLIPANPGVSPEGLVHTICHRMLQLGIGLAVQMEMVIK